ncbi:hypothetical protein CLU85_2896 [Acidovorax sp. 69]|uniref:hypothetical protein n=1 Tax=Acidovorax sp. 69 TaxID=2035202 RepID=UPI000C23E4A7|nr:hypothetical protein [Acidovorax sp. 69]PJI98091.1 hypothetical protein CLU85_2896 [Acidovorax sp. 69]
MFKTACSRLVLFSLALFGFALPAHAALSAVVLGAISTLSTDLIMTMGAVITVFVVPWGLAKLSQKLGFGATPEKGYSYGYWDGDKFIDATWSKRDDAIHNRRHGG